MNQAGSTFSKEMHSVIRCASYSSSQVGDSGVYALLLPTGLIKVGHGNRSRTRAAQTYFSERVTTIGWWPCVSPSSKWEVIAHNKLNPFRVEGGGAELFNLSASKCIVLLNAAIGAPSETRGTAQLRLRNTASKVTDAPQNIATYYGIPQ